MNVDPQGGQRAFNQIAHASLCRNADESMKVLATHQLMPELAEPISNADVVVFVDACHDGQPGRCRCETIRAEAAMPQVFVHYLTPVNLLDYAAAIFDARSAALLISVTADSLEYGETLTPNVAAVVPDVVDYIYNHCCCQR